MSALAFDRPAWLLLVLVTPALFVIATRSLGDFSRAQLASQATLRALVLGAVAVALAGPSLRRTARAVSAVALLDVSDSMSDAALARAGEAVSALRAAAARTGSRLRLVRFAATAEELRADGSAPLARFPPPLGAASDLALATSLGAGLLDEAALPRLLLVSDGEATRGDLRAEADRLAARGVPLFALALPPSETGDVAVAALTTADDVRPRAPFPVEVRLLADRPTRLRVRLDGADGAVVDEPERTVDVAAGATSVTFVARITEPGVATLRARLLPARPDRHPENDEGVLAVATEREPRVLALEGAATAATSFAHALESEHIAVDVRPARALPARSALDRYDLVVLSDVPRAALGARELAALDAYVRDGGGLLVAGGADAFGSGGWQGTRLEPLLPVLLDLPEREDEATLALALAIDRSGSMAGPKMELTKEAARATVEMLPPSDLVAITVFDSQAAPIVHLQRASNRVRILSDIGRIQASGGTNILAGLREAFDELASARARKKHIILLTDGQSPYEGIPDLIDAAVAQRITISAIGVGDGADQAQLRMIATRGGGRFQQTRDPASLPRLFSRETSQVSRRSIVEEPTPVKVQKRAEAFTGIPLERAPPLGGYAVTRPRPGAELLLAAPNGAPLLARWQVGLGQVAAWTSDVEPRWSAAWMRWPPFAKFWAQVTRATMRRRAANHFPLRATLDGDRVTLAVDAIGPDDRFLSGLDAYVAVTAVAAHGPAPPERRIALAETAPGHYEGAFRVDLPSGALLFQGVLTRAGGPVGEATGRLALPFAPEHRPSIPTADDDGDALRGPALLAAVAARTGGRVLTNPIDVLDPGRELRETRQPLRTQVLLAALALFLVDVLLRRVRFDALPGLARR
ncbi:MAG TPA: VWA domain-containing protein [Polyangia bacterium]|nr:VWA domain-containing protein [Polyangia bacterium]